MIWACGGDGSRVLAIPDGVATCPCCAEDVVAKCGRIVRWHWAHKAQTDCDPWSESETLWHAAWKSRYEHTEVVMDRVVGAVFSRHRADAVSRKHGVETVLEFQHSSLEAAEVAEREDFYGNMLWVVDACEAFCKKRISLQYVKPESGAAYVKFKWRHRRRSFDGCRGGLFLDLGMSWVPAGAPFWMGKLWWDDAVLKDGVPRHPGWWQRIKKFPCLLHVRKHEDGCGWGRIVSHEDFCRLFTRASNYVPFGGGRDCEYLRKLDFDCPSEDLHEAYSWCEPQLNHFGTKFIKKETV